MKKVRIGNIAFDGKNSIDRYYANEYFGKLEEYLADGWTEMNGFVTKEHRSIDRALFNIEELKYTIAEVERTSEGFDLRSVGARLVEISEDEFRDLKKLVEIVKDDLNRETGDD